MTLTGKEIYVSSSCVIIHGQAQAKTINGGLYPGINHRIFMEMSKPDKSTTSAHVSRRAWEELNVEYVDVELYLFVFL